MAYRILLADDSLTIQKVVELSFADSDFELMAVGSGDRAVASLDGFGPDLVLADVVMPGLSGYEVCEAVKARPGGATTPVVLLTGTFEPFDRARAERVGCDSIVTKPFDSHALVSLVADLIRKAEKAREELLAAPAPVPPSPPAEEMPFEVEMEPGEAAGPGDLETAETAEMPALEVPAPEPPPPPPAPSLFVEEPGYATVALPIPTPQNLEAMARAAAEGREPAEALAWPPPAGEALPAPAPVSEPAPEPVPPAETPLYELVLPEEPVEEPVGEPAVAAPVVEEPPAREPEEVPAMAFESFLEAPAEPEAVPAGEAEPFLETAAAEPEPVPFFLEETPTEPVVREFALPVEAPVPVAQEPAFAPEEPAFAPEEPAFAPEEPAAVVEEPAFDEAVPPLEVAVLAPAEMEMPIVLGDETEPLHARPPLLLAEVPAEATPELLPEAPAAVLEAAPEEDVFGEEPARPSEEELPVSSGEIPPPPPPFDAPGGETDDVEVETRDIERDMEAFEKSGSWSSRPEVWEQAEAMGVEGPPDLLAKMEAAAAAAPQRVPELATAPFEVPVDVPEAPVELEALAAEASLTDLSKLIPAKPAAAPVDTPTVPLGPGAALSDADVERIARRVVELVGEKVVREIAWDVVPELAERLVRERLRDIEA